jgi:hypothetical protein
MDRSERAKQFMAFSPLKGYYDLIKQKQKVVVERRRLTSDSAQELSYKISQVKVGDMVTVVYFCVDEYVKLVGMVSKVDFENKILCVVKTKIAFENIVELYGDNIKEFDE